jgi:glycosyltransferase involved in cell wall biosynthesis
MNHPLVSVIVPCYNHSKYIEQCITSIFNQTYANIELIVIDDGSKDDSFEKLKQLQKKNTFILESQPNMGLSKTLNKAITKYAKGKYVACIASDDYWHPSKTETQVKYFESHPEMGFIFSKAYKINDTGKITGVLPDVKVPECSFNTLILNSCIPALTVMINKKAMDEVGLFDEDSYIEDWDMWLRIADKYPFAFVDEFLAYYRLHGTNISSNYTKMLEAKKRLIGRWHKHPLYSKAYDNILLEEIGLLAIFKKRQAISMMLNQIRLIKHFSYFKSIVKLLIKTKL